MVSLDEDRLGLVFASRPDIINGIHQAADTIERVALFNNIANFIADQVHPSEPSAKRRRIDVENAPEPGHGMLAPPPQAAAAAAASKSAAQATAPAGGHGSLLIDMANAAQEELVLLEVKEVSVSIPQRKKYDLCFTKNYLYTKQVGTSTPVQGMVYKWTDVEYVFYAPIPEKQQLQHNYILFPRNTALSATKLWPPVDFEPFLFTIPSSAPKAGIVGGFAATTAAQVSDSYTSLMNWAITSQLQAVGNGDVGITATDARVFHSMAKQPFRAAEKAVHVRAHRGTKDGFLFFLPNGILWGYKKPLLFIPLDRIVAVSYTNILQRTFDITVEVDVSHAPPPPPLVVDGKPQPLLQAAEEDEDGGVKTEEIEFSLIDHEDYNVIEDNYIQRHGLNNRSMVEGRRATRKIRENGGKAGAGAAVAGHANGAAPGDPQDAALAKAEEMLQQDEEDEDEEDYDPGSDGESEGSGSSSEEESEDGEGGDDDEDDEEDEDEEVEGAGEGQEEEQ